MSIGKRTIASGSPAQMGYHQPARRAIIGQERNKRTVISRERFFDDMSIGAGLKGHTPAIRIAIFVSASPGELLPP